MSRRAPPGTIVNAHERLASIAGSMSLALSRGEKPPPEEFAEWVRDIRLLADDIEKANVPAHLHFDQDPER